MSTQLVCPYCGSTLNFGQEVAPGTMVSCLICAKSFRAATAPPVAPPAVTPTRSRPQPGTLVAAPPPRPEQEPRQTSAAGWLVVLVMLLLLAGGVGYVAWRSVVAGSAADGGTEEVIALNVVPDSKPAPRSPAPVVAEAPPLPSAKTPEDDGEDGSRKQMADKGQLQRKPRTAPGEAEVKPVAVVVRKTPAAPRAWGVDQERVDEAVTRGVDYLRRNGWDNDYWPVGYHALAGLTLLECKVPGDDARLRATAALVRQGALGDLQHIPYQLALAILFLDRLGDPDDRRVIQLLAARLSAGQDGSGGWRYEIPPLGAEALAQLHIYLHSHLPPHLPARPADKKAPLKAGLPRGIEPQSPYRRFSAVIDKAGLDAVDEGTGRRPMPVQKLPAEVRQLPLVSWVAKAPLPPPEIEADNSSTQFAILALWVARRHDAPVDHALRFVKHRFERTQDPAGGWGYQGPSATPSMTGAGLIGMAMGYAVEADWHKTGVDAKKALLEDAAVINGMRFLEKHVGSPAPGPQQPIPTFDLYFLWTMERTAMLYGLETIGGKDWYGWGAQLLLATQQPDGNWPGGTFIAASPHVETCLALLFLRRSNLARDLTENLRLFMPIRDRSP